MWGVSRRYSEFEALRKQIVQTHSGNAVAKAKLQALTFPTKENWLQTFNAAARESRVAERRADRKGGG